MKNLIRIFSLLILLGCAAPKNLSSTSGKGVGDTRTKPVVLIDENTYLLTESSTDKTYGYKEVNPVKVGSRPDRSGPRNEQRFLNALLGPNREELKYFRAGSCCYFKTPNGLMNNTGLLDLYRVYWAGGKDTLNIFINMYDEGDLQIPVGLTALKKN